MANRSIIEVAENILKPYIDAKDKAYAANIAPVETSPATSGHLTGTQIIYNGVLYDVIADIDATDALVVGTNIAAADDVSEQISDVKQALDNLTETASDNEPYILRQGKGNMVDFDLVGGSLGWNQLVANGDFADTSNWSTASATLACSNNIATVTASAANVSPILRQHSSFVGNHKYFARSEVNSIKSATAILSLDWTSSTNNVVSSKAVSANTWSVLEGIANFDESVTGSTVNAYRLTLTNGSYSADDTIQVKNAIIMDLTAMFGPTIADYIYSLEQANAGDGVAWFRQYFKDDYYAYNAGSLQHVNPSGRKANSKNLLSLESGTYGGNSFTKSADSTRLRCVEPLALDAGDYYISGIGTNIQYLASFRNEDGTLIGTSGGWSAINASFTVPENVAYTLVILRKSTGADISFSDVSEPQLEKGSVKTDYVPYEQTVASIPKVPLYGVPQLVNNKLSFDGDIRKADGSVTREYILIDLGAISIWDYNTSGSGAPFFETHNSVTGIKNNGKSICSKYVTALVSATDSTDKICGITATGKIRVRDTAYTDVPTFLAAMSGVYFVGELAVPTTEDVAPFQNPQRAFTDGIEEFIYDSGDVPVPVGNESTYYLNETLPQSLDYAQGVKDILDNKIDSIFKYNSEHNIESNTDLNNMKDIGVYYCTGMAVASTLSNCPVNAAFIMEVRTGNQRGTIVVQDIVYVNSTSLVKYQRSCVSGTWGSWFKFEGTVVS